MKNKSENQPEKIEKAQPIDRRKMLKSALAAGGAITAAAFLEGKWLKPVVKTGVLPVHAQSTCPSIFFAIAVDDDTPGSSTGTGTLDAVGALDPSDYSLLDIDGPISYQIIGFTGFDDLDPGIGTGNSGTLVDGQWIELPYIQDYDYTNAIADATVTVQWTFNGCTYVVTYTDLGWAPT